MLLVLLFVGCSQSGGVPLQVGDRFLIIVGGHTEGSEIECESHGLTIHGVSGDWVSYDTNNVRVWRNLALHTRFLAGGAPITEGTSFIICPGSPSYQEATSDNASPPQEEGDRVDD